MTANASPMAGKICLVTGTTSGIGKEAARGLAKLGATVVAIARDKQRGEAVVQDIIQSTGNKNVELLLCDLSSIASMKAAAAEFKRRHDKLHVLIHQAGLYTSKRQVTPEGLETLFVVNHLAYFVLTVLLLDVLKPSAPSRIIIGTGGLFVQGTIDFDDLQGEKQFKPMKALAQSKLGNMLLLHELTRRLEGTGVSVTAFEPGAVKTNLGVGESGLFAVMMAVARFFGQTPEQAAKVPVHLASAPQLEGVTGKYFTHKLQIADPGKKAQDSEVARKLWDASAKLAGLPA